jgi:hypothetical protein
MMEGGEALWINGDLVDVAVETTVAVFAGEGWG